LSFVVGYHFEDHEDVLIKHFGLGALRGVDNIFHGQGVQLEQAPQGFYLPDVMDAVDIDPGDTWAILQPRAIIQAGVVDFVKVIRGIIHDLDPGLVLLALPDENRSARRQPGFIAGSGSSPYRFSLFSFHAPISVQLNILRDYGYREYI
jgi:hypothetical protein